MIQNLTFEGERIWKQLPSDGYVELVKVLGPNNYLFIRGEDGTETVECVSKPYKGIVNFKGIKVHTVPKITLYEYSTNPTQADVIIDGGMITLVYDVGTEKMSASDIESIFDAKTRADAGVTLPACGLKLLEVFYKE